MEDRLIGREIAIDGRRFRILREYWRTKGSRRQRLVSRALVDNGSIRVSPRTRFLVGKCGKRRYWIKDFLVKPKHGGAVYELEEMRRLSGEIRNDQGSIGPVEVFAADGSRIAMEYLSGYTKLGEAGGQALVRRVVSLVRWWIQQKQVESYDLSRNNTLIHLRGDQLTVRLIDFGWSPLRTPEYWMAILDSWVRPSVRVNRRAKTSRAETLVRRGRHVQEAHAATQEMVRRVLGVPAHCAEVAACLPELAYTGPFAEIPECRVDLFEPNPVNFKLLKHRWGGYPNVAIHPVAISDREGTAILRMGTRGAHGSAYIEGVVSPSAQARPEKLSVRVEVPCMRFSRFDDGTIDFLLCDCEGSEWFVLEDMTSRPKLIQIELSTRCYRQPQETVILEWMARNGYVLCKSLRPCRDKFFVLEAP